MDLFNERRVGFGRHFATNLQKNTTSSRYGPYPYPEREQQNTYANTKSNNYSNAIGSSINRRHDFLFRRDQQDINDTPWQNRNLWDHDLPVNRLNIPYEREWHDDNYRTQSKSEESYDYSRNDKFSLDSSDLSYGRTERIHSYERQIAYKDVGNYFGINTNNIQSQNYSSNRGNARRNRTWKNKRYKSSTRSNTQGENATITSQNQKFVEKMKPQGHKNKILNQKNDNIDRRNSKNTNTSIHQSITVSSAQEIQVCPSTSASLELPSKNIDSEIKEKEGRNDNVQNFSNNLYKINSKRKIKMRKNQANKKKKIQIGTEQIINNGFHGFNGENSGDFDFTTDEFDMKDNHFKIGTWLGSSVSNQTRNVDSLHASLHNDANAAGSSGQEVQMCPSSSNPMEVQSTSSYNKQRSEMMLFKSIEKNQNYKFKRNRERKLRARAHRAVAQQKNEIHSREQPQVNSDLLQIFPHNEPNIASNSNQKVQVCPPVPNLLEAKPRSNYNKNNKVGSKSTEKSQNYKFKRNRERKLRARAHRALAQQKNEIHSREQPQVNSDLLQILSHNEPNIASNSNQEIQVCPPVPNLVEAKSRSNYNKNNKVGLVKMKQRSEMMLFKSIEKSQNYKFKRNRERKLKRRAQRAVAQQKNEIHSEEQPTNTCIQVYSIHAEIEGNVENIQNSCNEHDQSDWEIVQVFPYKEPEITYNNDPKESEEFQPISSNNETTNIELQEMEGNIESVQNTCSSSSELHPCSESDIVCKNRREGSIFSALQSGPSNNENINAEIQEKEENIQNSGCSISHEPGIIHDNNLETSTCSPFKSELLSISNNERVNDSQEKEGNIEIVQNSCFDSSQEPPGSTSLPLKSVNVEVQGKEGNVENVQNISVQSCSDSSRVLPCREPGKTHDKEGLIPSPLKSGEVQSKSSNNESVNIEVQEKEDVQNIKNLCIQPCSSSLQVLPYDEPDDNKPEGSICSSLESGELQHVSSSEDEELEMAKNEENCSDKVLQRRLKKKMRRQKYKEKKKQRKQENQARKGLPVKPPSYLSRFSLRPFHALKLLSADGTDFLNMLGIATNLKITVIKLITNSYMCTLEGSDQFKLKAKEAVERFWKPMQLAPTNLMGIFSSVNCSKNSVQHMLFKLSDPNISWKRIAETLHGKLEQIGKEIQIRLVRLQENAFPSPRKYQDCRRALKNLIKEAKTRYMILNSIILVKLFVADARVHMQVLQLWILEGADTEINNSVQESFNYIFKNDVLLNVDYKAVMKMLPNGAQALQVKQNVNYLMTTGTTICDAFKSGDKLKTLKRAYANVIINDYSDESVKNLNMEVMALQQLSYNL